MSRLDPSGKLCIRVGPAGYYGCGKAEWNAEFVPNKDELDKLREKGGGFLIQLVCTKYVLEVCPDDPNYPLYRYSVPCPDFDYPFAKMASPEYACYFEMWTLNSAGKWQQPRDRKVRNIEDSFQSVGMDPSKTRGSYVQVGYAYLVYGAEPPDGWDKWEVNSSKPSHDLYYRCDEPTGVSKEIVTNGPGREWAFNWDCCCEPPKSPPGTKPSRPKPGVPPYVELGKPHIRVINKCPT